MTGPNPPSGPTLLERCRWTAELVSVLAPRELRTRYRQSVLDIAWALIHPWRLLAIYGVVLTQSFNVTGEGVPYLSLAWSGLVLWTFFATSLGGSASCLISSQDLVTKVYFPREALPIAVVGASLADLGIGLVTVMILVMIQGIPLTWHAALAVLPVTVLIVWAAAIGVFVAVFAAFIRDMPHLVSLVVRVGFFASPVMYDESTLPPALQWTSVVSPVAVAINGFRAAVLRAEVPDLPLLSTHLVLGSALLAASVLYTRSVESRVTDVV